MRDRSPSLILLVSPVFTRDQPEAVRRFTVAVRRGQRDGWRAFGKKGSLD
jgi:hypothetical protein